MSNEQPLHLDELTQQAVDELRQTIADRYPTASFEVTRAADDPQSVHLLAIVDVDDPDEVGDLVVDRVVHMQVEGGIPVHVIPIRTLERVASAYQVRHSGGRMGLRR